MLSSQRERAILQLLQETGSARIESLATRLGVTDETIRRNLKRLQAQGMVTRVHGGVHLKDWGPEASFAQRMVQNPGPKRRIAEAVARMLPDGASLFLDVGSTTAYVAQALRVRRELLVVTNSLAVAQALTGVNGNQVFMAGGELRGHVGGGQGEGLEAGEAERAGGAQGVPKEGGGQQVEAGAEAKLGDVEAIAKAGGQAVALQEDVAGLVEAAGKGEIGVVEAARDGDIVAPVQRGLCRGRHRA